MAFAVEPGAKPIDAHLHKGATFSNACGEFQRYRSGRHFAARPQSLALFNTPLPSKSSRIDIGFGTLLSSDFQPLSGIASGGGKNFLANVRRVDPLSHSHAHWHSRPRPQH
jgi:hypothetical protein